METQFLCIPDLIHDAEADACHWIDTVISINLLRTLDFIPCVLATC